MLKSQPDFDCLPIPAYWFKKFGIPPREAVAPREYIESNYAMKRAVEEKELPPLIVDEPQDNGRLVPIAPPDDTTVEVVNRPFEWKGDKPFPAVIVPELENIKIPECRNPELQSCMSPLVPSQQPPDQHE